MPHADSPGFLHLEPERLRAMMASSAPSGLVLVDVRSAEEYAAGHIPGARLAPLPELDEFLDGFAPDRLHVFYCHSGVRSLRAAWIASSERGVAAANLTGGIVRWRGHTMTGLPELSLFRKVRSTPEAIRIAAGLERATHRFYERLADRLAGTSVEPVVRGLARLEEEHSVALESMPGFETAEGSPTAQAEIMESGERLDDALERAIALPDAQGPWLLELALAMEYAALDLYENLAARAEGEPLRSRFEELAASERRHVKAVLSSFGALAR